MKSGQTRRTTSFVNGTTLTNEVPAFWTLVLAIIILIIELRSTSCASILGRLGWWSGVVGCIDLIAELVHLAYFLVRLPVYQLTLRAAKSIRASGGLLDEKRE